VGVAGWLGGVGGGGAGGFCANATGTRSPIATASSTKIRMRGFTDLFLGRERLSRKFIGLRFRADGSGDMVFAYGQMIFAIINFTFSLNTPNELTLLYRPGW
jgi:hypothetical protein